MGDYMRTDYAEDVGHGIDIVDVTVVPDVGVQVVVRSIAWVPMKKAIVLPGQDEWNPLRAFSRQIAAVVPEVGDRPLARVDRMQKGVRLLTQFSFQ